MLEVDFSQVEELTHRLEKLNKRALPFAVRMALNDSAEKAKEEYQQQMRNSLTLRNRFTLGSVRVERVRGGFDIRRMESLVGSIQPYMATQEEGGTKRSRGKHGTPIPTSLASGEGRNKTPRRRVVRKANKLSMIRLGKSLANSNRVKNSRQYVAASVERARRTGRRFVYLEFGTRKGIFRIRKTGRSIDMIWDLSHESVPIPPNPMMRRALRATQPHLPRIHEEALRLQIEAALIFGR